MPEAAGHDLDVAVVVCTHTFERRRLLEGLIDSLVAGTVAPREVVVVVDRNPELAAALGAHPWPRPVTVIESAGAGLAAARNTGWRAVTAPLVAFIDDDAVASPTWLEELAEAARSSDAGVIGGRIDPVWEGGEPSWYSPMLGWVVGCSYEGQPTEPAKVRNVIGCNMLVRRDLLVRLGGFETTLGRSGTGLAGAEETELCIRAGMLGVDVLLIPGARVVQVLPAARATLRHAIRRGWAEGRSKRMLVRLHGGVLGTESDYAGALLRQSATRLARGVLTLRPVEILRAVALVAVLGATTLAYFQTAVPRRSGALIPPAVRS